MLKLLTAAEAAEMPGCPASRFVTAVMQPGAAPLIRNVKTEMRALEVAGQLLPVSIDDGGLPGNSYVVSPLTTYADYAGEEADKHLPAWLGWPVQGLIAGLRGYLTRQRIDRVVTVNNWLLSTNLYPAAWDGEGIETLTGMLTQLYPDHALMFRSLNRHSNGRLLDKLTAAGYLAVPSRQVYLFDARAGEASSFHRHRNCHADATLQRRSAYRVVRGEELQAADFERLEELYRLLYLEKYSYYNPQFTSRWIESGIRDGWLTVRALRDPDGKLDGVVGWFGRDAILTAPLVGYDTSLPPQLGLYRLLTRLCLMEAAERREILNFSSGAAHFKRLRGGAPEIEYSAVYVAHLPPGRQRAWRSLARILQGIGVPIMRRFKL